MNKNGDNSNKNEDFSSGAVFKIPTLKFDKSLAGSWPKWKQIFKLNMTASNKMKCSEEMKIAILLTHMGEEAIEVFNTMEGEKDTMDEVICLFDKYCVPSVNLAMESYKFNKIKQSESQSFDNYLTELKSQAQNCQFVCNNTNCKTSYADRMIIDHIVCNINDKEVQQTLLKETKTLKLDEVALVCRAAEVGKSYCQQLMPSNVEVNETNRNRPNKNSCSNDEYLCKKCGNRHGRMSCPAFGKKCTVCGKMNHFAVGCFKNKMLSKGKSKYKKGKSNKNVNEVENDSSNESLFDCESVEVLSTSVAMSDTWKEFIEINGHSVNFKLDTASDINILPLKMFNKIDNSNKIQKTNMKIKSYGGFILKPVGTVKLSCCYKDTIRKDTFVVVNTDSSPILSGSTCSALGLIKRIYEVNESDSNNDKESFVNKNKDVFSGLGKLPFKVKISLREDAIPVVKPARRIPESLKPKLKIELDRLEKLDVIEKIDEPTDWVHDFVIVEKKDGNVRLCLNPIPLNKYIKREHFCIPTQEELIANLSGKKLYTVLDMKEGFHQFVLDEESAKICTFNTPFGRYCYKRMPFGMSSFPEIFHRENTKIFGDIKGVQVLFDDIVVSGVDEKDHDRNLEAVLKKARLNNIKFNINKIQYKSPEVKYIGLIFSSDGIKPDPVKVKAITDMEEPKNVKDIQRYLGAINYINKFIPSYSNVTAPLRELLKKNTKWSWDTAQRNAFNKTKQLIVNAPTLKIFDHKKSVEIQCDASKDGIGCCLLQEGQPVAFGSRSLKDAEKNYSQIEKEMLSIVFGVNRFHQYIYGHENVKIFTDHKPLITIIKKELYKNSARLQRMQLKLLKYKFTLEYLPGTKMFIADMLSRAYLKGEFPEDIDMTRIVHAISLEDQLSIPNEDLLVLQQATKDDINLSLLIEYTNNGWLGVNKKLLNNELKVFYGLRDKIVVLDGLVFLEDRLIVPAQERIKMIKLIHSRAHLGITKTVARIRHIMYWPNMSEDIAKFINSCKTCQVYQNNNVKEPLISSKIPKFPFEMLGMDIGEYKEKIFLAIEDYYSRWLEIIPLKTKRASEIVEKLKVIFSTHGTPVSIRCDNNPFNSIEMINFAKQWSFKLIHSSPHYPKSNGLSEKGVGIAKKLIKKSIHSGTDFFEALQEYRVTPIAGLEYSPSQLLMGRTLRTKVPVSTNLLKPKQIDEDVRVQMEELKFKVKKHYDSTAKVRDDFSLNQPIYIRWKDQWKEGEVTKVLQEPRSYIVTDQDGVSYRRNSVHIRERKDLSTTEPLSINPITNPSSVVEKPSQTSSLKESTKIPRSPPIKTMISERPKRLIVRPKRLIEEA